MGNTNLQQITYIPIEQLHPHPDNPRKDLGDISELAESIKAKGVLQNLTVVPGSDGYTIIIGHRRHGAAKLAGLAELPCVVAEMDDKEQVQTMLLENMQRSDLTVYEQAQGFQMMLDLGSTVEEISAKTGFSQTTVRRRVKMMELDQGILKEVSERQLSLSDFDQLAQIEDLKARNECLQNIGTANFNNLVETKIRRQTVAKMLPKAKAQLKQAKAKALKQSDTWSSKYDTVSNYNYLHKWDGETPLIPKKIKGQVYYYLSEEGGYVSFYEERKRAKPVKRSPEEIERQKKIKEAWEKATEIAAVAYKLRSDFIKDISLTSKNKDAVLKGAISACISGAFTYGGIRTAYCQAFEVKDTYTSETLLQIVKAFEGANQKTYPLLVYTGFADGESEGYINSYKSEPPRHNPNPHLDILYTWLCSLGYEMSDEEKAMQDGTHEIFKTEQETESAQ